MRIVPASVFVLSQAILPAAYIRNCLYVHGFVMSKREAVMSGRVRKAPESFIDADGVRRVHAEARQGRRDFIRQAFAAAAGAGLTGAAAASEGDPNILTLPAHTTGLGQGVASEGYGKPSKYEANVQRRQSPGL